MSTSYLDYLYWTIIINLVIFKETIIPITIKNFNLLFLFAYLCLASCSAPSYLSTISSTAESLNQNEIGEFILENDSLQIVYNFRSINAPIHIEVYNKLSKPLYIDWNRSAIIINNLATNYLGKTTRIQGHSAGSSYVSSSGYSWGSANFVGSIDIAQPISIIPPKSKIKETHLSLKVNFNNIDDKNFAEASIGIADGSNYARAKQASFTREDTPFIFNSYLTLQYENEDYFHYDDAFYVKKLIVLKDKITYKELPKSIKDRADIFYISK